jgi:hypothetical protein
MKSHAMDHKSTNPFDLPNDSDFEQSNMVCYNILPLFKLNFIRSLSVPCSSLVCLSDHFHARLCRGMGVCSSLSPFELAYFNCIYFFLISNSNLLKSAKGCNPYTREVYKRAPKRVEQKINLKNLQK